MKIGILALQGDYAEHRAALEGIGVEGKLVKHAEELNGLAGLILPGGESTTMLKFLFGEALVEPLQHFYHRGGCIYGTCAGAILLAKEVASPTQSSLELMDISIERNGYGRQVDSHISIEPCPVLGEKPLEMVFIRAPIIRRVGEDVDVLAHHQGEPVFLREERMMVTTFHPELAEDDDRVHRYFVEEIIGG